MHKLHGISLLSLLGQVYAKCLEKRCREIIEPKLGDTQCGFRPGRSTTDQISLSSKFSRNLGTMPQASTHILSTSRKHTAVFLVESFGKCCGNMVLTAAFYWPLSHTTGIRN